MGSMKDIHIETLGLTRDWHDLIAQILSQPHVGKALRMRPDEEPDDEESWQEFRLIPDLVFTPIDGSAPLAVEFKMFRWQSEWRRRVRDAIAHMREILEQGRQTHGIIILSRAVEEPVLAELKAQAGDRIDIWPLQRLQELARADDALDEQLWSLVMDTVIDSAPSTPPIEATDQPKGTAIAAKLRATVAGQPGWQAFELACADAVKFLFGRELHRPTAQKRSGDGLHRMDLICRIRSESNSFWSMISSDFSTRYVVFDAKNYEAPIGQDQVELTKKYLFNGGLRTVAILLARDGGSDNARIAAEQILREDRKLVLIVSMSELCAMLEGTDAGNPPENFMFEKVDEMLMGMGR